MLSKKSKTIYLDSYDVKGVITALKNRIAECEDAEYEQHMRGACIAFMLLMTCDEIRNQRAFMTMFENAYADLPTFIQMKEQFEDD